MIVLLRSDANRHSISIPYSSLPRISSARHGRSGPIMQQVSHEPYAQRHSMRCKDVDGTREFTINSQPRKDEQLVITVRRFGRGPAAAGRFNLQSILHHTNLMAPHGAAHQPIHRRIAWWPPVGGPTTLRGGQLLFHGYACGFRVRPGESRRSAERWGPRTCATGCAVSPPVSVAGEGSFTYVGVKGHTWSREQLAGFWWSANQDHDKPLRPRLRKRPPILWFLKNDNRLRSGFLDLCINLLCAASIRRNVE